MYRILGYLQATQVCQAWKSVQGVQGVALEKQCFQAGERFQVLDGSEAFVVAEEGIIQRGRSIQLVFLADIQQDRTGHLHGGLMSWSEPQATAPTMLQL